MAMTYWPATGPSRRSDGSIVPDAKIQQAVYLPVTDLLVSYVLLIPLLVFAVHGGFSFEHPEWNSGFGALGGNFAVASTSDETLQERVQAQIALGLCVLAMLPHYRRIVDVSRNMPLILSLPLYAILSALWSQDGALSLRSGISLLISTFFAFYLASRFSPTQQVHLLLMAGTCVAVMSIVVVVCWPRFGLDHQLHEGAWQGLFTQKNTCAELTLFFLTPALAITGRGRYGQILRALYITMCLVIISMTKSRTGWVITAVYLGFVGGLKILGIFERKSLLPLAALLFALVGLTTVFALRSPALILKVISRSGDLSGRAQIWQAVMESIGKHPIGGYGFDAFWSLLQGEASSIFAATGWVVTGAHSGFLNVGLELGMVGLFLVAATFVQAFRNAQLAFRPGRRSSYVDWCIGIVFLTLIYNFDERTLMATQYLPWILYMVACVGLAQSAQNGRQDDEVATWLDHGVSLRTADG
jgi:exopolysaccharide production protein ExoQ